MIMLILVRVRVEYALPIQVLQLLCAEAREVQNSVLQICRGLRTIRAECFFMQHAELLLDKVERERGDDDVEVGQVPKLGRAELACKVRSGSGSGILTTAI